MLETDRCRLIFAGWLTVGICWKLIPGLKATRSGYFAFALYFAMPTQFAAFRAERLELRHDIFLPAALAPDINSLFCHFSFCLSQIKLSHKISVLQKIHSGNKEIQIISRSKQPLNQMEQKTVLPGWILCCYIYSQGKYAQFQAAFLPIARLVPSVSLSASVSKNLTPPAPFMCAVSQ